MMTSPAKFVGNTAQDKFCDKNGIILESVKCPQNKVRTPDRPTVTGKSHSVKFQEIMVKQPAGEYNKNNWTNQDGKIDGKTSQNQNEENGSR